MPEEKAQSAPYTTDRPVAEITEKSLRQTETGYLYDNESALAICVRDMETWDNYVAMEQWATRWIDSDVLYQSPQSISPYGQGPGIRASVPNFLLSNTIDAVLPKMVGGLFYEDPPFLLRPRPGTTPDIARAKTALFAYQLSDMKFEEQCERALFGKALRGTCILKWGWHEERKTVRRFKRKAAPEEIQTEVGYRATVRTEDSEAIEWEYVEKATRRPYIENKDISRVGCDPATKSNNIQDAKWTVERDYVDWGDLESLRQQPDYRIPSKKELLEWFFRDRNPAAPDNVTMAMPESMMAYLVHATPQNIPTSADPLAASLEIIERQDANSIVTVLRHGRDYVLVRNSENPFAEISRMAGGTGHTYLSSVWRPIRDSYLGLGLGQIIGTRQMVAQGTENLSLEILAYALHPTFIRKKGWNVQSQDIRLGTGRVIEVEDDVQSAFKLLEMPSVPAEAWQTLSQNKAESEESSGANQQVSMGAGAPGIRTTGMRSGTGAQLVGAAVASRLDGPMERFCRQVFVPWLYIMDALNNQLLPTSTLREVLSDSQAKDLSETVDHVEFRNAQIEYEVLAGAHLGPKKEMTQFMQMIEQIAINPALLQAAQQAGMKFNFRSWFKTFADLSGMKYSQDFFVDMTDEERKQARANSPSGLAAQKAQSQQQSNQQKYAAQAQLQSEKELLKAGGEVVRSQAEHALDMDEPTFGSETVG